MEIGAIDVFVPLLLTCKLWGITMSTLECYGDSRN